MTTLPGMPKNDTPDNDTPDADISALGYEEARDELAAIVARLESGTETLEESMRMWERGEALAAHCERWLDGAQQKIDAMTAEAKDD